MGKYKKTNPKEIFPSTEQSRPNSQLMEARTFTTIKDEPLTNMILFTFVSVVLLEILVPKT
jgi:hypothetical protein